MAVSRTLTADEFFVATKGVPRTQLVDGEIVVSEPSIRHNRLADFLAHKLAEWCEAGPDRGEAGSRGDVPIDEHNVFVPDVWWVPEHKRPARDAPRFSACPDLVIEILSPSTRRYDLGPKRQTYERGGASELWIVDPETDSVTVLRRSAEGSTAFDIADHLENPEAALTSRLLPGFSVTLRDLFDR